MKQYGEQSLRNRKLMTKYKDLKARLAWCIGARKRKQARWKVLETRVEPWFQIKFRDDLPHS
jgi:hypothetical protein